MKSLTTSRFWKAYDALPDAEKQRAHEQFLRWLDDPQHPSLHFKNVGGIVWSARVSDGYRALALKKPDALYWFWIGSHREYEKLLKRARS